MPLYKIAITFTYVVIVSLGLGVSWQVFHAADNIYSGTIDLVDNKIPAVQRIEEVRGLVVEHERVLYEYYATTDQAAATRVREPLELNVERLLQELEAILGASQELTHIAAQFQMIEQMADQLDKNLSKGRVDWDLAREQLVMLSEYGRAINPLLDTLLADSARKADLQRGQTLGSTKKMKTSVAGYAVIIALIAGLIALLINRYLAVASEKKLAQERLSFLAMNDEISGLPNRYSLEQNLDARLKDGAKAALALIRVDGLERYSNNYGSRLLTEILVNAIERIRPAIQPTTCTLYRLNDSTLAIVTIAKNPENLLPKLQSVFSEPVTTSEGPFYLTLSIGYAKITADIQEVDQLVKKANTALTSVVRDGGNAVMALTEEMMSSEQAYIEMERDLKEALSRNEFHLHYQPKINAFSGEAIGFEALIRWHKNHDTWVRPDQFIAVAEQTGQILQIGHWVIVEACQQVRRWLDAGLEGFSIAVNISPRQFQDHEFIASLQAILSQTQVPPEYLELEITESLIMQDVDKVIAILHAIKKLGVRLSIDDFGTGYSSMSYLTEFPVDKLKIDKSFVDHIEDSESSRAIVKTIIDLAHHLKLTVVAEGVENQGQLDRLKQYGCEEIQGYLFSRPVPAEEARSFIKPTVDPVVNYG